MQTTNIEVSFRIMGDEYDVDEVSKDLGLTPTITWSTGEVIRNTGKKRTYTAWIYSTGAMETLTISEPIREIERILVPQKEILCYLKKKYRLDYSIDITIITENNETPAIFFKGAILYLAAEIDATIDVDMYIN